VTIGDPDTFAVMFDVAEAPTPWLFGKCSYIVGNAVVGNYHAGCSLRVAIGAMRFVLEYRGRREDAELMRATTAEAFSQMNGGLYVDAGQSDERVAADKARFLRLEAINIGLDVFDGWKCFLVEDHDRARFIWCHEQAEEAPREVALAPGEFDTVVAEFVEHIEAAYGSVMWNRTHWR
jgi:hypothetical protein